MATTANSLPMFRDGSHYIINVLSASQLDLCQRFATLKGDRFAGVDYRLSETGLPVLANATARFECHNRSRYDEGDHIIFVGEVERCGVPGAQRAPWCSTAAPSTTSRSATEPARPWRTTPASPSSTATAYCWRAPAALVSGNSTAGGSGRS